MTPEEEWVKRTKEYWLNVEPDKLLVLTHISNLEDGQIASVNGTDWGVIETVPTTKGYSQRQLVRKDRWGREQQVLCDIFSPGFAPEYVFIHKKLITKNIEELEKEIEKTNVQNIP